jgi:hypothetical protein
MAHFAEIDNNNVVLRVLVVNDSQEHRGQEFLATDMGLGGTWIQTSYNNSFRKQFAGQGFTYDLNADVFIRPQPYPSWSLDANYDWQAPIAYPNDGEDYYWNEVDKSWIKVLL